MTLLTCIQKQPHSNPERCTEYIPRSFSHLATSGELQYKDIPRECERKERKRNTKHIKNEECNKLSKSVFNLGDDRLNFELH